MKALRILPFLVAPAFVGCDCGPQVFEIAPQIYLDACKSPDHVVGTVHVGGFDKCSVDFGASDISVKATKTIKVTNPSSVELTILDLSVIGDPSFELVTTDFKGNKVGLAKGDTIGPGLSGTITVSVRPNTASSIKSTLFVKSDANNTPQTPDGNSLIQIPLTATGVDNGVPQIEVSPTDCNYDRVPVGGVKVCTLTISNKGTRGLVLDSVAFVPPGSDANAANNPLFQVPTGSDPTHAPFAFAGRPPSPDEEIEPTNPSANPPVQPVTIDVQFRPDVLGTYLGKILIKSNDPTSGDSGIPITLQGTAVTPPTCVAKIKSINGDAVGASTPQIAPLDDVVFSLEDSTASTPNGSIGTYQWNIAQAPSVSRATLSTPSNVDTDMQFDSDGIHHGVDFAGEYKMCGQVGDDLGVNSVNECCVSFTAIPKEGFHVELSWDTATHDIDLHVTKKDSNGEFCAGDTSGSVTGPIAQGCGDTNDCNWSDCKAGNESFGTPPEWDGIPGRTDGDPSLDVDDLDGFGPENININKPVEGDYLISVEGYTVVNDDGSDASADVLVNVFIFGQLSGSFTTKLNNQQWWEAAIVHWPADPTAQLPCIEDLTDGNAHDQCG